MIKTSIFGDPVSYPVCVCSTQPTESSVPVTAQLTWWSQHSATYPFNKTDFKRTEPSIFTVLQEILIFFSLTFYKSSFVGSPGAGIHQGCVCVCLSLSVRYTFISHLLLLLVAFSLSLTRLHLSEILINNQGSTMLRCFVMGS